MKKGCFFPYVGDKHASFDVKKPLMEKFNHKELCSKIKENIDQILVKYHCPLIVISTSCSEKKKIEININVTIINT